MTPEQRVTAAIDCTPYAKATPDAYADAALDAVRDALTSDDPEVVRAMAERVGLVDLHPGESVMWRANQRRHILATPWREVPNAD